MQTSRQLEEEARRKRLESNAAQARLDNAYSDVAATEAGAAVLRDMIAQYTPEDFLSGYAGNSRDAYNVGKAYQSMKLIATLRRVLDREVFLSIVYPKEK